MLLLVSQSVFAYIGSLFRSQLGAGGVGTKHESQPEEMPWGFCHLGALPIFIVCLRVSPPPPGIKMGMNVSVTYREDLIAQTRLEDDIPLRPSGFQVPGEIFQGVRFSFYW